MTTSGPKYLTNSQWKAGLSAGEATDAMLIKTYAADEIKTLSDRQVQVVISTGAVDREKDSIDPNGWDLKNFKKANGPVLFAHDYKNLPVAKTKKVWIEDDKLKAIAEFATAEEYQFADTVYRMIKGGFLNAASVGFRPLKFVFNEEQGGYEITKSELLEYSFCPVGANQEALVEAKAAGINIRPFTEWAERHLDNVHGGKGVWLPEDQVEAVFRTMNEMNNGRKLVSMSYKIGDIEKTVKVDGDEEDIKHFHAVFDASNGTIQTGGITSNGADSAVETVVVKTDEEPYIVLIEEDKAEERSLVLSEDPKEVGLFTFDEAELKEAIMAGAREGLAEIVGESIQREINYQRGRLD